MNENKTMLRSRSQFRLLLLAGMLSLLPLPTAAVQLADGKTYFTQPPRLLGASATQKGVYFPDSTYFFSLELLPDAGEPLQTVVIRQEPSPDAVRFDPRRTEAFVGTLDRAGANLPLQAVTFDRKSSTVTVTFASPVPPGQTVTIGLYAIRNPDIGGVYLYGVTALPAGAQPYGQFLGYGRIQIYNSRPGLWFR